MWAACIAWKAAARRPRFADNGAFPETGRPMNPRAIAPLLSLLLLVACASAPPVSGDLFTHGVASGDMRADSTVLWTRTREAVRLTPELSRTPGFEAFM